MLAALLLAMTLGPHAREAELHARDPEASWVREEPAAPLKVPGSPALAKRVYGYLPYWQSIDLNTFHWELVSDVIAFSAGVGTDGTISNSHSLPGAALVSAAHAHGVRVHLCATLMNSADIATFLGSAAAQTKASNALVALAQSSGIDGLNLDFEFVSSTSRDAFTAFVNQLHGSLRSAIAGAELTIAMPASVGYTGYDAPHLAAERLLLMEYDYHWANAPTAGPVAQLTSGGFWSGSVEGGVNGFLQQVAAEKLAMGVPYYGYQWPTDSANTGAKTQAAGTAILFHAVYDKFASYGRLWDSPSQTPWYKYAEGAQNYQGWADDDQSLTLKYQYINQAGLAGVMIWALGYDNGRSEAWDALRAAFVPPPATEGVLQLVSAAFSPASLEAGQLVTATLVVQNTGGKNIGATAPTAATVYDDAQSSTGSIAGTWRLALDSSDRPAAQQEHPWRWGLDAPLAPGSQATLTVQVRLERPGTRTLWAAVMHEGTGVMQDDTGATSIEVVAADAGTGSLDAGTSDAGSPEPEPEPDAGGGEVIAPRAAGCASAGGTPLLAAGLALLLSRTSLRRRRRS